MQEAPSLVQAYLKYRSQGVEFVGLVPDTDPELVEQTRAFLQQAGITWPTAVGAEETISAMRVEFFPSHVVVGKDGKVLWNSEMGGTLEAALERAVSSSG
ncbi:MAG: TlpA family protein disulfide reductase [Planctomycetales bacterium]|nr:TlpA family protein disulfide reductase [Planctomycetales bacterium]